MELISASTYQFFFLILVSLHYQKQIDFETVFVGTSRSVIPTLRTEVPKRTISLNFLPHRNSLSSTTTGLNSSVKISINNFSLEEHHWNLENID